MWAGLVQGFQAANKDTFWVWELKFLKGQLPPAQALAWPPQDLSLAQPISHSTQIPCGLLKTTVPFLPTQIHNIHSPSIHHTTYTPVFQPLLWARDKGPIHFHV